MPVDLSKNIPYVQALLRVYFFVLAGAKPNRNSLILLYKNRIALLKV